jgi:hypothetical protein
MNITRHNYEEFFMLYADHELPAAERTLVEDFIAANPDLRQELELFEQFKLQPDAALVFAGKDQLLKNMADADSINLNNCHSFFILYADNELSQQQKAGVELFVYQHPQVQAAFEMMQQLSLEPDKSIIFENKQSLYRKEKDDKVIPFGWWRLAVAAMVLLVAGLFWLNRPVQRNLVQQDPVKPGNGNTIKVPQDQVPGTGPHSPSPNESMAVKENAAGRQTQPAIVKTVQGDSRNETAKKRQPAPQQTNSVQTDAPQYIADTKERSIKSTTISSVQPENMEKVVVTKGLPAVKSNIDQPAAILNPDENNLPRAEWASSVTEDNVEVLNTSVNTKNSMRGFLRKASRLIAKKASLGETDGNRKGILIAGFEIATR